MEVRPIRALRIVLLTGSLIVLVGTSLASFSAVGSLALGLFAGLVIAAAGVTILSWLRALWSRARLRAIISTLGMAFALFVLSIFIHNAYNVYVGGPCASPWIACSITFPSVQDHTVTISPVNMATGVFSVEERMIYKGDYGFSGSPVSVHLMPHDLRAERSGFFLQRVEIPGPAGRRITVELPDGDKKEDWICGYYCNSISIELREFPAQAFHAARAQSQPEVPTYPGPVTIRWVVPAFYSGRPEPIAFWYYPSESRLLLLLLRPFAGIASLGGLLLVLGGLVGSLFLVPFVLPAMQDVVKDWIKQRIKGSRHSKQGDGDNSGDK